MIFTKIIGTCRVALVVAAAVMLAGCASGPKAWNLSITKTTPASIEVDLIGITEADRPAWEAYDLDKYWSEGDYRRKDAQPLSMVLELNKPWVIAKTDPKWKEWMDRRDTELLVIANLPGKFDAGPGDGRRRILPLTGWDTKDGTVQIEVRNTEIVPVTPQKQ